MPLQTALLWGLAKTNKLRGSSGEVLQPLYTENYAPQEMLEGTSENTRVWGRVGGNVQEATPNGYEFSKSWTGLTHPNSLIAAFSAAYGIVTAAAEGTAYKYTWPAGTLSDPLPVVVLGRYSTAATSYALIEKCYINNIGLKSNLNGSLETTLGFYGVNRTLKVATPTYSLPDMTKRFRVSNVTAYQTVFSFTPDTGSLDDIYTRVQTFDFGSPRPVANTGSAGGISPNYADADPSPLGIETLNFTTKDSGGSLTPLLKETGYDQGNASGAVQTTWSNPISGTVSITILGGLTVADITKKYTLNLTGHGMFRASYAAAGGTYTCRVIPDNFWERSIIGDTASIAQPT